MYYKLYAIQWVIRDDSLKKWVVWLIHTDDSCDWFSLNQFNWFIQKNHNQSTYVREVDIYLMQAHNSSKIKNLRLH